MGKGYDAGNHHFSPMLTLYFLCLSQGNVIICYTVILWSANSFNLDKTTILLSSLTEWCFLLLSTLFQSYPCDSSHYSCLSWVLPILGWGSEVWLSAGPLHCKSNTLQPSHAGLPQQFTK